MRCPQHEGIVCRDPSVHSKHLNFYGSWTMNNGVDFSQRKGHKYCKAGRRQSEVLRRGGSNRKYKYKNKNTKIQKYKNTNSKRYGDDRWGGGSNHWQLRPIHRGGIPTLLPSIPTLLPQQFFILNFNHVYDALHRHVETSLSVVLICVRNTSFAIFWPRICFVWYFWSWSQKCILRGSYVWWVHISKMMMVSEAFQGGRMAYLKIEKEVRVNKIDFINENIFWSF